MPKKEEHLEIINSVLSTYQGDKWWKGSLPTTEEWAAYLVLMEGGILVNESDKVLLAQILLYKIDNWGLAEFTPVTNPDVSTNYEMYNFTKTDWDKLINPDPVRLKDGFDIVEKALINFDPSQTPNYLYWVSQDEVETAIARGKDVNIQHNYHKAATYDNKYLMFLQAYEDFSLVINP